MLPVPPARRQHFSGDGIPIVAPHTGEVTQAALFIAVLGASNFTYAEAFESQQLRCWIDGHIHAYEYWDGVPEISEGQRMVQTTPRWIGDHRLRWIGLHPTAVQMVDALGPAHDTPAWDSWGAADSLVRLDAAGVDQPASDGLSARDSPPLKLKPGRFAQIN